MSVKGAEDIIIITLTFMMDIASDSISLHPISLQTGNCHDDNLIVTGDTTGCYYDNLLYH